MSKEATKGADTKQKNESKKAKEGPIYINGVFPLRNSERVYGYSHIAVGILSLYLVAWLAVWTGQVKCPMIKPSVKYLEDKVSMVFAGWKLCSIFYMILVNLNIPLNISNVLAMIPYIVIDYFAVTDTDNWTPLAYGFLVLDVLVLLLSLTKKFKAACLINWLYVFAGLFTFCTMSAPVLVRPLNNFQRVWAGWKFAGCMFFALINLGVPTKMCTFTVSVLFLGVDLILVDDYKHWRNDEWDGTQWFFVVHVGLAGMHQLMMFMDADRDAREKMQLMYKEHMEAQKKEAEAKTKATGNGKGKEISKNKDL